MEATIVVKIQHQKGSAFALYHPHLLYDQETVLRKFQFGYEVMNSVKIIPYTLR